MQKFQHRELVLLHHHQSKNLKANEALTFCIVKAIINPSMKGMGGNYGQEVYNIILRFAVEVES